MDLEINYFLSRIKQTVIVDLVKCKRKFLGQENWRKESVYLKMFV